MTLPLVLTIAALSNHTCRAYEMVTHAQIATKAYEVSTVSNSAALMNLGLRPTSRNQQFPTTVGLDPDENDPNFRDFNPRCEHGQSETVERLIACGAMFEDAPSTRSLRHFFDPAHRGGGMTILGFAFKANPDWAISRDDSPPESEGMIQEFSYWSAREYLFKALTTPGLASATDGRDDNWGKVFQSLGQLVHLVQDMTQPQHVRNDPHYDGKESIFGPTLNFGPRHPSRYEKYTGFGLGRNRVTAALTRSSFDAVFPAYRERLPAPRAFWTGSGSGVADYTNTNFVSQRTNFVAGASGAAQRNPNFFLPEPGTSTELTVITAFAPDPVPPAVAQLCSSVGVDLCKMTFWSSLVTDNLTGQTTVNPRAATESVFDEDLRLAGVVITYSDPGSVDVTTSRLFSLNRLNFDALYPFLISKAVNYSAGLLNYFFRGQMQIDLPAAGVFSVVDHATENCPDSCGFRLIKLQLTNTTPNEQMSDGSLVAVVKFRRNTCYQPDLTSDAISFSCRSADEEVVVSNSVAIATMNTGAPLELPFIFSTPVPINATDVFLQVVFRGRLGGEQGAVAIATKDISEPTFISTYNLTDFVALPGGCFKAADVATGDALWNQLASTCKDTSRTPRRVSDVCANIPLNIRYTGGQAGREFVVKTEHAGDTDGRIPPRRFSRFAVLMERGAALSLNFGFHNAPLALPDGSLAFNAYELEETLDGMRVENVYSKLREVNSWEAVGIVIDGTTGTVGTICDSSRLDALEREERMPVPSTIAGW